MNANAMQVGDVVAVPDPRRGQLLRLATIEALGARDSGPWDTRGHPDDVRVRFLSDLGGGMRATYDREEIVTLAAAQ